MDDPLPGVDFSEIINEEDDSGSFGDSNILVSPREDDEEVNKHELPINQVRHRAVSQRVPVVNDRTLNPNNADNKNDNLDHNQIENQEHHHHHHDEGDNNIKPVFDCLY